MKNIILLTKYYLQGFILASGIGCLFILHSLFIDDTYSFIDFSLYMQVNSIMAVFFGLHLWIIYLLDNPETIKNKFNKLFFKGFASYWLGIVFSLALLATLELLNCFVSLHYLEYLTDDSLFLLSLLMGWVVGILILKKLISQR